MTQTKLPTTVAEAFKERGIPETAVPDVSMIPERFRASVLAHYNLMVVTESVNGPDYSPDFTNRGEEKCVPWFFVKANEENRSGFGLSYGGYAYTYTRTNAGARHVFEDADKVRHTAQYFGEYYEDYYFE